MARGMKRPVRAPTIIYVHDPMCSWCWGYRPVLDELRSQLSDSIGWRNLLGGLAPDSEAPMPDETRAMVMDHWRRIQAELGTEFNFDFWTHCRPRRSTYPACRAVIAARAQGAEEAMIGAIQRAYYLRALNPSNVSTLIRLAAEIGLDRARFASDLGAAETRSTLLTEIGQARAMGISRFPALVLDDGRSTTRLPVDYHAAAPTLVLITKGLSGPGGPARPGRAE